MDTAMRLTKKSYIPSSLIMLFFIFLSACSLKDKSVSDYQRMSVSQLERKLYEEKDLECFTELVTRSFYEDGIDIEKHAHFLTDSLKSINALTFIGNSPEECAYYMALNEAYGIDGSYVEIVGIMSVKDVISNYLVAVDKGYRLIDTNTDSLRKCIIDNCDTIAYQELRSDISLLELKKYAQLLADSASFPMAIQDMYNIICVEHWNGYPMDSATFALANGYLEKGVEMNYLPSIFQKSLLLLMGVYLPQDTIEGKRLLDQCLINPPCKIPFWRKP